MLSIHLASIYFNISHNMGQLLELILRVFFKIIAEFYPEIIIGLCLILFILSIVFKIKSK